ncbi:MAG: hypothetical protein ACMG6E_05670 [Candidatus Roizmanbacteria bacterium]
METADAISLIEVLAETFNICEPDIETLKAEVSGDQSEYRSIVLAKHNQTSGVSSEDGEGKHPSYIDDFLKKHEKFDIRKIDLLKISAIEILMSLI